MRSFAGFAFEELSLGQSAAFETVVGEGDIDAFAVVSGDTNPLHVDRAFARGRGYGGRVAHGAYLVALASRFVGVYLPGRDALLLAVSMSFLAPVLEGTRIIVSGVVDQMSEGVRSIVLKLTVVEAANATPLARGRLTVGFTKAVPSEGAA